MEQIYDFRKKLTTVHEEGIRDTTRKAKENEYALKNEAVISISKNADAVMINAAKDFQDFLKKSMNVNSSITNSGKADINIVLSSECGCDMGEYGVYRAFCVSVNKDGITVCGYDSRGAAQGLFYIEDMMTFEKAPVMPIDTIYKKPLFSPQMVHSSYELDQYPDEYLNKIAHEGRDAILVFTKEINKTPMGYLDFNDLVDRAGNFGLDVYAYSYIKSEKSPDDSDAEEYYDNTYGRLFRECPKLKGVTLVGESVQFPSKDKNVTYDEEESNNNDGIPTGKTPPGWWPCEDYPDWLNVVKKVIRKYNPDADIVFWTYNWGFRAREDRLKLIETLPTDITLQATFEMFELRKYGAATGHGADYSLSIVGPGEYFSSEAEAAKRRGLKLYSMTNTGGLTWDFGVIPYEPMPYQWMKRYAQMRKANEEWSLSGIMECHHYGFYPSFISKLSKWCFWAPYENMENVLKKIIISEFGKENYKKTDAALRLMSEAIEYYTPSDADQYGAFRVGPSYPFCFESVLTLPENKDAMFGNKIYYPTYHTMMQPQDTLTSIRVPEELKFLEKMKERVDKAVSIMHECDNPNDKLENLINLFEFIMRTVNTGINAKKWYLMKARMQVETDIETLKKLFEDMESLLLEERENAKETIPLVEKDSRLGWEPSMHYMTDRYRLEWKMRQIDYVLKSELPRYKNSLFN